MAGIGEVKREIGRIVDATAARAISNDDVRDRITPLREERERLGHRNSVRIGLVGRRSSRD